MTGRTLRDRFDGFNYGYRMKCDCGEAVYVSQETYFEMVAPAGLIGTRVSCSR